MSQPRSSLQRSMSALKTFTRPKAERCELCALEVPARHQHLIDPKTRKLICTCDGCAVLFDASGATQYRRVPRDVRKLPELILPDDRWERLLIPINLAFMYRSSVAKKVVSLYPSAAGVTESLLELEPWEAIAGSNPDLAGLREDIEALLINRLRDRREYYIAPIDRCFELVGTVRTHWKGFTGGDRVWDEVAGFFDKLREEARS
jgi:hypothetical protein